ncbi:hypothetical protein [Veillonella sp.]|uniref:hypothetical protein n=1 Tax=Veillonella sp. TaxID=1926307 RepID=UPI0025EA0B94|nr:hypothetical protein [Veillonella sp.]
MINRSYLPFLSARTYKDRKMAKWMGFFLSDYQTALLQSHIALDMADTMSHEERLLWLGRLYAKQCKATFHIKKHLKAGATVYQLQGVLQEINLQEIVIKTVDSHYITASLDQIIRITTEEMDEDGN